MFVITLTQQYLCSVSAILGNAKSRVCLPARDASLAGASRAVRGDEVVTLISTMMREGRQDFSELSCQG